MAQHDYDIANAAGAPFRADINAMLAAAVSNNSAATTPPTTFAFMWWADTTAGLLKQRNAANSAWISVLTLATGLPVNVSPRATRIDVASVAGTVDLTTAAPDTDDIRITGALAITVFTVAIGRVIRVVAGGAFSLANNASIVTQTGATLTMAAGDSFMLRATAANVVEVLGLVQPTAALPSSPAVRQTVLSGPVDTGGFSAFGGSTGSTTVTATGTLKATAAAGGDVNYTGSIVNPSWTGLSTNGTMFLFLDITAAGVVTTGSTTLAPTYRWGGTDVVTNLQNTFNIQEMMMKVGNGTTAAQVYRVFVGEVTVAGGVVTAITWYALMGRYANVQVTMAVTTAYSFNTNIGASLVRAIPWWECKTADAGYAVGDRIYSPWGDANGTQSNGGIFWTNRNTCGFTIGQPLQIQNKTTGANATLTLANWQYSFEIIRGF